MVTEIIDHAKNFPNAPRIELLGGTNFQSLFHASGLFGGGGGGFRLYVTVNILGNIEKGVFITSVTKVHELDNHRWINP